MLFLTSFGMIILRKPVKEIFTERTGLTSVQETREALKDLMEFEYWGPPTESKTYRTVEYAKPESYSREKVCPHCGAKLLEKYAFCTFCGAKLI